MKKGLIIKTNSKIILGLKKNNNIEKTIDGNKTCSEPNLFLLKHKKEYLSQEQNSS